MAVGADDDLSPQAVQEALPRREVRTYPALLSTEAEALSWARAGAPAGAVVVADYQAAPRGRAGYPLEVEPGEGLGFSLVLRPRLPPEREGWLYVVTTSGLADVLAPDAVIEWPDTVRSAPGATRTGAVGMHVELGPGLTQWAVATVVVPRVDPPRALRLAELVAAIEQRYTSTPDSVLDDYRPRCTTLGRTVRARLVPMGPSGPQVSGEAVECLPDGALVVVTDQGNRVAVRPQHLGVLEDV